MNPGAGDTPQSKGGAAAAPGESLKFTIIISKVTLLLINPRDRYNQTKWFGLIGPGGTQIIM